jgi:hypothetical protein
MVLARVEHGSPALDAEWAGPRTKAVGLRDSLWADHKSVKRSLIWAGAVDSRRQKGLGIESVMRSHTAAKRP